VEYPLAAREGEGSQSEIRSIDKGGPPEVCRHESLREDLDMWRR